MCHYELIDILHTQIAPKVIVISTDNDLDMLYQNILRKIMKKTKFVVNNICAY